MANLTHFQSTENDGMEFVSVCGKGHHNNLNTHRWVQVRAVETFAHVECDLCEFDKGQMPYRLTDLENKELIKRR